MQRRSFLVFGLPTSLAGIAIAQNAKQERWSGNVDDVDTAKMAIQMHTRKSPGVRRTVNYDDNTKITLDNKPATAKDAKPGYRIVALGKFEGNNLKATQISLFEK